MLRSVRSVRPAVMRVGLRQAHAISNPTLMNLENRWEKMSSEERNDIIEQLAERQKGSWKDLTVAEKRAAWYISYGAWGPRRPVHPEGSAKKIVFGIGAVVASALVLFGIFRAVTPPLPKTMSKEWQEKSNEILAENNANPFSGYNQIQSPSRPYSMGDEDE